MNYKDLISLLIIFILFLALGIRLAEQGVNSTMGLDLLPKSFSVSISKKQVYTFCVLGKSYEIQRTMKIGEIYAGRQQIAININGKKIIINTLIYTGVPFKNIVNLDKRHANMYN